MNPPSPAMPSIEIACIDLAAPVVPPATSFSVVYEAGLKSHRSPSPRFQRDFDQLSGCLYHIGNPGLWGHAAVAYFAYEVLSEASREASHPSFLEFDEAHVASARALIQWLLNISPCGRILFTSDWQFGPSWARRFDPIGLHEFWGLHDSRSLLLNAAYPIANAI